MIHHGDFYCIPVLPKEMRNQPKGSDYKRLRAAFTPAKEEFVKWAFRDRHRLMNKAAKAVLSYLVGCVNFDTGRCDPSQETIAEELGMGVRSVGRAIKALADAGWLGVSRRGLTTTNFYRLRVPVARIEAIKDDLAERKALRLAGPQHSENFGAADVYEPVEAVAHQSEMADQDKPILADQDKPEMADKPMNRTSETEPLNKQVLNREEVISTVEVGAGGEVTGNLEPAPHSADVIDFPSAHGRHRRTNRLPDKSGKAVFPGFGRR